MAIALGGIQKHKYKCQNLDHCIFISRVIALEHRILTTTMHQSSPSSTTKSKSAKKQKKHYCMQTLIIYQTWVSNIHILKLFYWKNVSCFIVDDKTVALCEILLIHSFVLFCYSFIICYYWLVWKQTFHQNSNFYSSVVYLIYNLSPQ